MNKSSKPKIFLTGAAGFIGRELTKKLVGNGYFVSCFDLGEQFALHQEMFEQLQESGSIQVVYGTLLDRISLQRHIQGHSIVIHLAAMLGVRRTEENRLGCIEINITGTDNVLNACVFNGVKHFVFSSSSEVYGEPNRNPIGEEDETKGKTVYAVTKLAGEELAKGYNQLYPDLNYTVVRLFNTYGEGQVSQFVLARFVHAVIKGEAPTIYGDGEQLRGYCHVDDTIKGFCKIISDPKSMNKTYNLGNSDQVLSLKELGGKVIQILAPGKGLEVEVLGTFEGTDRLEEREIFARYCDTSKIKKELGFQATISVEEGVRRIADYGVVHEDWPTLYKPK